MSTADVFPSSSAAASGSSSATTSGNNIKHRASASTSSSSSSSKPIPIASTPSASHGKTATSSPFGGYSPTQVLSASLKATVNPLAGVGFPRMALDTAGSMANIHTSASTSKLQIPPPAPAASILLNPIRKTSPQPTPATSIKGKARDVSDSPSNSPTALHPTPSGSSPSPSPSASTPGPHQPPLAPAPVVTHIPAVPTEKELQRRREKREREKQKEKEDRERKEREAREMELAHQLEQREERVWGIPKKAFYMGLGSVPGSINFNAQMAILGGWGNGSGGLGDMSNTPPRLTRDQGDRKRQRKSHTASRPNSSRQSSSETFASHRRSKSTELHRPQPQRSSRQSSEEEQEKLDPEELAALNAIINTRRSMAAAKALASGEVKLPAPKRPVRPDHGGRGESQESVPSRTESDTKTDGDTPITEQDEEDATATDLGEASASRPHLATKRSESSSRQDQSSIGESPTCPSGKVRFAPLPRPTAPLPTSPLDPLSSSPSKQTATGFNFGTDAANDSNSLFRRKDGFDSEGGADDDGDSAYDSDASDDLDKFGKRLSSSKSKWYLMGLPPQAFKPEYYRQLKRWSVDAMASGSSSKVYDQQNNANDGDNTLGRRTSTGSLGVMSAAESERKAGTIIEGASGSGGPDSCASSITGSTRRKRSRRGRRHSRASLKGSSSVRSPSAGSGLEEEDRIRRRQLILASRPGGTGMVTLPDGTKVKARRVGEGQHDTDDLAYDEWGFAGLARQKAAADADAEGDVTLGESPLQTPDDQGTAQTQIRAIGPQGQTEQNSTVPSHDPDETLDASLPSAASNGGVADSSSDLTNQLSGIKLRAEEVQRRHEEEMYALSAEVLAAHRRRQEASNANGTSNDSPSGSRTATADNATNNSSSPKTNSDAGQRTGKDKPSFPSLRPVSSTQSKRSDQNVRPASAQLSQQQPAPGTPARPSVHPLSYPSSPPAQSSGSSLGLAESPSSSPLRTTNASRTSLSSAFGRLRSGSAADGKVALPSPISSLPRKPDAKGYTVVPLPSELGIRPVRPQEGRVWNWSDDDDSDVGDTDANNNPVADSSDEDEGMDDEQLAEEDRRTAAMQAKRATTTAAGLERIRSRNGSSAAHLRSHSQSQRPSEGGSTESTRGRNPRRSQTTDVAGVASADSPYFASDSRSQAGSGGNGSGASHSTPTRRSRGSSMSSAQPPSLSRGIVDGVHTASTGESPPAKLSTPPSARAKGKLRSTTSSPILKRKNKKGTKQKRGPAKGSGDSAEDDDLEYWPRSAAQMFGLGTGLPSFGSKVAGSSSNRNPSQSPTRGLFNRSSSNISTSTSSPSNAVLLAETARARAVRERWERERLEKEKARKAQEEKDDDAMDYGWPPTLKGSLYDR